MYYPPTEKCFNIWESSLVSLDITNRGFNTWFGEKIIIYIYFGVSFTTKLHVYKIWKLTSIVEQLNIWRKASLIEFKFHTTISKIISIIRQKLPLDKYIFIEKTNRALIKLKKKNWKPIVNKEKLKIFRYCIKYFMMSFSSEYRWTPLFL
jgi:hypothetical protein